jgi:hypothetical protein
MHNILLFLYFIGFLVSLEGNIRSVPEGRMLLEKISSGTISFVSWRAKSDVRKELAGIKYFFGWTFLALILSLFLMSKEFSPRMLFSVSGLVISTFIVWYSFSAFLDIKKQIKSWSTPIGIITVVPWFYALMEVAGFGDRGFFNAFHPLFYDLGVEFTSIFAQTLFISVISFFGAVIYFVGTMLVLLVIPATIFIILKMSVWVSKKWGAQIPKWLRLFWLFIYVVTTMYLVV